MFLLRHRTDKVALRALRNRQAILQEGLSRRDLMKMGLLSGSGYLLLKDGLSSRASAKGGAGALSPPLTPFVEPMPIMPVLPERPISELGPTPTNAPNRALNPATGLPFEGRTELHQARAQYPAQQYFVTRMGANPNARTKSGASPAEAAAKNGFPEAVRLLQKR